MYNPKYFEGVKDKINDKLSSMNGLRVAVGSSVWIYENDQELMSFTLDTSARKGVHFVHFAFDDSLNKFTKPIEYDYEDGDVILYKLEFLLQRAQDERIG